MVKTRISYEIDIPQGYEWSGEYRKATKGELFMDKAGRVCTWPIIESSDSAYPILRKAEVWVQLTPEKAVEFMVAKKPVTLRHIAWTYTGQTITREIDAVYYDYPGARDLSIDLEVQAHIKNIEYLKESE